MVNGDFFRDFGWGRLLLTSETQVKSWVGVIRDFNLLGTEPKRRTDATTQWEKGRTSDRFGSVEAVEVAVSNALSRLLLTSETQVKKLSRSNQRFQFTWDRTKTENSCYKTIRWRKRETSKACPKFCECCLNWRLGGERVRKIWI